MTNWSLLLYWFHWWFYATHIRKRYVYWGVMHAQRITLTFQIWRLLMMFDLRIHLELISILLSTIWKSNYWFWTRHHWLCTNMIVVRIAIWLLHKSLAWYIWIISSKCLVYLLDTVCSWCIGMRTIGFSM